MYFYIRSRFFLGFRRAGGVKNGKKLVALMENKLKVLNL